MRRRSNPNSDDSGEIVRNIPSGTQDVNIVGGVSLTVDLDNADDDVLIYGWDGSVNRKILTNASGRLQVDVVTGGGGGSNTPTDAFANPTDAIPSQSFLMGWNGSAWDRVKAHGTDGDSQTPLTNGALVTKGELFGFDDNGPSWDRLRTVEGAGTNYSGEGLLATGLYAYDGTNWDRVRVNSNGFLKVTGLDDTPGDTFPNSNFPNGSMNVIAALMTFNNNDSTWARVNSYLGDSLNFGRVAGVGVYEINDHAGSTDLNRVRIANSQSTTGITTNAAGTTVDMSKCPMSKYTMIIDRTAGATDVVDIRLEVSLDGVIFVQATQVVSLVGEPIRSSAGDIPARYMRYNVVTVGTGNTLTIQLLATR